MLLNVINILDLNHYWWFYVVAGACLFFALALSLTSNSPIKRKHRKFSFYWNAEKPYKLKEALVLFFYPKRRFYPYRMYLVKFSDFTYFRIEFKPSGQVDVEDYSKEKMTDLINAREDISSEDRKIALDRINL